MKIKNASIQLSAVLLIGFATGWTPAQADEGSIGLYGTVEGTVMVAHPGALGRPVKLQEPVLFQDMIETHNESRTKALFDDDSILTVGENSKVQITEYVYNPNQNIRSAVVHLLEGRLRALVAKAFKGPGSKFEIHTPTAVAAARGTYFIVWSEGGTSGMVNIGEEGKVDFTSAGKTVTVAPGHYSMAPPGQPPSQPAPYQPVQDQTAKGDNSTNKDNASTKTDDSKQTPNVVAMEADENDDGNKKSKSRSSKDKYMEHMKWVSKALADTKVKDRPRLEKPMDVLRALRHDAGASSRVAAKLGSDKPGGRVRNDRRLNGVNDSGNGNGNSDGQDNENNNGNKNAGGVTSDSGRGKGDGGNDGNKGPLAKVGDVLGDRGNGDAPKGDKAQGGGEGNNSNGGNSSSSGNGNAIGDSPKDRGRGGEGNGDGPKDRGRNDGNNDGPKDKNRWGDGSKVASPNLSGGDPGKTGQVGSLSAAVTSSAVSTPVASPVVTSPVMSTPMVASPVISLPVTQPILGAPVTPTVPVSPPAVITGAASIMRKFGNSGPGGNNGKGGKNK